jgi:hypothetical protein
VVTIGTIEVGHASDTTVSRSSAGIIAVEGVAVPTISSADTLSNKTLTAPKFADLGFIADANGNELFILDTVASAVNEITFANAATAGNPKFSATGGDTNIGIDFQGKGTGVYRFLSTATAPAEIRLYEDTDDGSNYTAFKVAAQSADITYTLPDTVAATNGHVLASTTGGVLSWVANGAGATPTVITTANEASDTTCFLAFFTAATGDLGPKTNANLAFNSSTGVLTLTAPVLGTPTSGTLTNCTGLPLTGLVSDTTTALGIGSINLGHASDTTIARSGAGDITIEGNAVYRAGGTDVAIADGGTGSSTAAGAFTNLKQGATTTATGVVEQSTKAENEASTSDTVFPSVLGVLQHVGSIKSQAVVDMSSANSVRSSFGLSSWTDRGSGAWTHNLSTAMASNGYAFVPGTNSNAATVMFSYEDSSSTRGSCTTTAVDGQSVTGAGAGADRAAHVSLVIGLLG